MGFFVKFLVDCGTFVYLFNLLSANIDRIINHKIPIIGNSELYKKNNPGNTSVMAITKRYESCRLSYQSFNLLSILFLYNCFDCKALTSAARSHIL